MNYKMSAGDVDRAKKAAAALLGAFVWKDTPQGHKFWQDVYSKLSALGRLEPNYTEEPKSENSDVQA